MQCPNCAVVVDGEFATECPRCGVVFSKFGSRHIPPPIAKSKPFPRWPWFVVGVPVVLFSVCTFVTKIRANRGWYQGAAGYEQGVAEHNTTHKPILVYFYTDW